MNRKASWDTIDWTKGWIFLSSFLTLLGLVLSAFHRLDRWGYGIGLGIGGLLLLLAIFSKKTVIPANSFPCRAPARFRRFFPLFFLILWTLALLGGALYSPNNYDALTYRFPRILHWLAESRWHWIATGEVRQNLSGVGMEWLMTPLFVFTHSDRFFFLINVFSYALLPGLTYGTFTRLGVSKRMAWYWMWLLPCGYCFVAQAGSIGNDTFPVVYLLASLYLALRFQTTRKMTDLWAAMLGAALLTGIKTSNLPLLAVCGITALPALRLLKGKLLSTMAVAIACIGVSAIPLVMANIHYTGDWTGDPHNSGKMRLSNPAYALMGNALQIVLGNIAPPIMPLPQIWNAQTEHFLQSSMGAQIVKQFPRIQLKWGEFQVEESAGLGLGVCALLTITVAGAMFHRNKEASCHTTPNRRLGLMVAAGGFFALLIYMAKMGSESAPRLLATYYPLIIFAILILPGTNRMAHKHYWKVLAAIAALSALPSVILAPSRPLWPAITLCNTVLEYIPDNRLAQRALTVYSTYRNRNDSLGSLRKYIPQEVQAIGFLGCDRSEVALWKPFGQRRVEDITPQTLETFLEKNRLILTYREAVQFYFGCSMEEWLSRISGTIVAKESLVSKVTQGTDEWYIIQTQANPSSEPPSLPTP